MLSICRLPRAVATATRLNTSAVLVNQKIFLAGFTTSTFPKRKVGVSPDNDYFQISEEVIDAVETGKPVVALESTIYTHGFPHPENLALAKHLESIVREHGAVPATIGVIRGIARVGMSPLDLQILTTPGLGGEAAPMKVSRRDLAYICGMNRTKSLNGGTTIAGTIYLANLAKIPILATGGLGGVHRGGEDSLDISADLTEMGRTPVTVISSGCKSFLDIPRTLEYLETEGVTVATFADGRDRSLPVDYPAFWSRDSGVRSPFMVENEAQAAAMMHARYMLRLQSALHFANPIPTEAAILKDEMDGVIRQSLQDAADQGVTGKDNTPFILDRIRVLTAGKSVIANRALISSNVIRGAKVAVELARIFQECSDKSATSDAPSIVASVVPPQTISSRPTTSAITPDKQPMSAASEGKVDLLVAGSVAVDVACDFSPLPSSRPTSDILEPRSHTSNRAIISQNVGGVGYNVARAAYLAGASVRLCSSVGDDLGGRTVLGTLRLQGISTTDIEIRSPEAGGRTAQYVAVNDATKNLVIAMADMSILEQTSPARPTFRSQWLHRIRTASPRWLAIDTNWDVATLREWIASAKKLGAKVAIEPVSVAKSSRIFPRPAPNIDPLAVYPHHEIELATPNAMELTAMCTTAREADQFERQDWWEVIDALGISSAGARDALVLMTNVGLVDRGIPQQAIQLLPFIPCLLTTLGSEGVLMAMILRKGDERLRAPETAKYILSRSTVEGSDVGGVYMRLFAPAQTVPEQDIVSVNGVGDTFLGVLLAGLCGTKDRTVEEMVDVAQMGSVMTIKSEQSVHPRLAELKSEFT